MDNNSKRRLQLTVGFTVFAIAVAISYFSVVPTDPTTQDIFLVIDVSGSMAYDSKLDFAQQAASEFVNTLRINHTSTHHIGLITFANEAYEVVDLTDDYDQLTRGISNLRADGGTAMGEGINLATLLFDDGRLNAGKTIVLLSDGAANLGTPPLFAAQTASSANVKIFSVGYGYDADVTTLKATASITSGEYFDAPTGQDLAEAFETIAESLISPASHYSSRVMMLLAIPILLFIPAIEAGITTMMQRADAPIPRNISKKPCPYCKHSNRPTAKFCLNCGKSIGRTK